MEKIVKNICWSMLFTIIASLGMSMTLKAGIGLGSINSLSSSLSYVTNIQVGTVLALINVCCVLLQLALQRKDFHWRQWLQLGISYILGLVVNVMVYSVFPMFTLDHYIVQVLFMIVGVSVSAIGIAGVIRLNLIVFPIEAASKVIADKYQWSFRQVRQMVDVIAIALACLLSMVFAAPLTIREGTMISMFMLAPVAQFVLHWLERQRIFESLHIK